MHGHGTEGVVALAQLAGCRSHLEGGGDGASGKGRGSAGLAELWGLYQVWVERLGICVARFHDMTGEPSASFHPFDQAWPAS